MTDIAHDSFAGADRRLPALDPHAPIMIRCADTGSGIVVDEAAYARLLMNWVLRGDRQAVADPETDDDAFTALLARTTLAA